MELDRIIITGARQHNLKNVTVEIPKKKLVVFTGVSGSGKSCLAFDTLYAEGQRRYVESLYAYARQFLGQMEKPRLRLDPRPRADHRHRAEVGVRRTRARPWARSPRSTTTCACSTRGWASCAATCAAAGRPSSRRQQIVARARGPAGGHQVPAARAPGEGAQGRVPRRPRAGAQGRASRACASTASCSRSRTRSALDKKKKHTIEVVVDRLVAKADVAAAPHRLGGDGAARRPGHRGDRRRRDSPSACLSEHRACPFCGISFPEPTPQLFSFNSPLGMCPECTGLGTRMEMDPDLVVPNPSALDQRGRRRAAGRGGQKARAGAPTSCARWPRSSASTSTSPGRTCPPRSARCCSTAPATSA